jgi:hypothetical protein
MNKNDYYHSFKTRLESLLEERFRSRVEIVNLADPKIFLKKSKPPFFDQFCFQNSQRALDSYFIPA